MSTESKDVRIQRIKKQRERLDFAVEDIIKRLYRSQDGALIESRPDEPRTLEYRLKDAVENYSRDTFARKVVIFICDSMSDVGFLRCVHSVNAALGRYQNKLNPMLGQTMEDLIQEAVESGCVLDMIAQRCEDVMRKI